MKFIPPPSTINPDFSMVSPLGIYFVNFFTYSLAQQERKSKYISYCMYIPGKYKSLRGAQPVRPLLI